MAWGFALSPSESRLSAVGRDLCPVVSHKDPLPYLVRRLRENGANSSFVHRLLDSRCPVGALTQHPVDMLLAFETLNNRKIPLLTEILPSAKLIGDQH